MRIGTICYCTDQGIAHLAKDFYDHGVITDVAIFHHSAHENHPEWYPPGTLVIAKRPFDWPEIRDWMRQLDAMLFFETPFDWDVIGWLREQKIKSAVMPMYECMPKSIPHQPDLWLCPSKLDLAYYPPPRGRYIPVPVAEPWSLRTKALRFLHNGGHLGLHGHKGTRELLLAMEHVKSPIELTIRAQDGFGLEKILREVHSRTLVDDRLTIDTDKRSRVGLFDGFDVYVAPEKYNGLSLPLQEARAAGMLVMTSDRFPHNDWLPNGPLIPVKRYFTTHISGRCNDFEEAVIEPQAVAAKIDEWFGQDITALSRSGQLWADNHSWNNLKPLYLEALSK